MKIKNLQKEYKMKFTQEDFMKDYFKEGEQVIVDAIKLQKFIASKEALEREVKSLMKTIEVLNTKLLSLEAKVELNELEKLPKIDLKV